jgi:hypothetical protein
LKLKMTKSLCTVIGITCLLLLSLAPERSRGVTEPEAVVLHASFQ